MAILWALIAAALKWIVLFVVCFAAVMLLIVGIVKIVGRVKKSRPDFPVEGFAETPEYVKQLSQLLCLLADDDEQVVSSVGLFCKDKVAFGRKYLADMDYADEDFANLDYWILLVHALRSFGYLSYNDWKFSVEDALFNLAPVLAHYGLDGSLFDDIPDQYNIMMEEALPMIGAHMPEGYILLDIYTGEDSYAITVASRETALNAVSISDTMEKPLYNTGIHAVGV